MGRARTKPALFALDGDSRHRARSVSLNWHDRATLLSLSRALSFRFNILAKPASRTEMRFMRRGDRWRRVGTGDRAAQCRVAFCAG